jgi:formamidopyrimidine-DNA glycosylase
MPELPEVEAIVRRLRRTAVGARIESVRVFRPRATHPQPPARLNEAAGLSIRKIERRGKNIVLRLDAAVALRIHLRMTGDLEVIPHARLHTATVRVLFALHDGRALAFDDPRLLGTVHFHTDAELEAKLADIGADPMSRAFTPEFFVAAAKRSRRPAKLFLMDQYPVSGIGNMYAAEALFRARIHPAKPIGSLRESRLRNLHAVIGEVLREAIPAVVRSYSHPGDHEGMDFCVYGRRDEPCRVCGRKIKRVEQGGRSTYYCPNCQRR